MNFDELLNEINQKSSENFSSASNILEEIIFSTDKKGTITLISEIGIIPESIGHDTTEEKLYTKASEILFAKALKELGFTVQILKERSDCADIIAQSKYHNYSLVGDAKAFRLSRTAKNQKDFKVSSMNHWRGDCDFSVLICPYYQYPKSSSQIYKDALNLNVALFSWEYLYVLLKENIKETKSVSLKDLWNQSAIIAQNTTVENAKSNYLDTQNVNLARIICITNKKFDKYFAEIKKKLVSRGYVEIEYYENEIKRIKQLNRNDAIKELLICLKLDSKINTIRQFINQVEKC